MKSNLLIDRGNLGRRGYFSRVEHVDVSSARSVSRWLKSFVMAAAVCLTVPMANAADSLTMDKFAYTNKLMVAGYTGTETLQNFPVLVRLSETRIPGFLYANLTNSKGADIAFFDELGNHLASEIQTNCWTTSGESLVWVKVPSLAQGTIFTMFFKGTSGVANDPSGVWTDYTGVWHLNGLGADDSATWQSQGLYPNSTATSGIDGHLSTNSVPGEPGRFGKSFRVNDSTGPSAGNYAEGGVWVNDAGADSPLDAGGVFTISGWFKHGNWNFNWDNLFYKRMNEANNADPTGSFMARISSQVNETKVSIRGAGSSRVRLENASEMHESMIDNWVYLTLVFNGTTGAIYENGALCRSGTFNVATDNDAPLVFGNTAAIANGANGEQAWNGWIDEVRYLRAAKSADWIAAEYAAMAGDGFLTAGAVERIPRSTILIVR